MVCTLEGLAEARGQIACRKADARTQAHLVLGRRGSALLREVLDRVDTSRIMMLFSRGIALQFSCQGEIGLNQPSPTTWPTA